MTDAPSAARGSDDDRHPTLIAPDFGTWLATGADERRSRFRDRDAVLALRDRLSADGVELVEHWDEPDYVSVKCRDPDGYIVEASWEPERAP